MGLRSDGRKYSFEILSTSSFLDEDEALIYRSKSDRMENNNVESISTSASPHENPKCKKRKHKKGSKRGRTIQESIPEDPITRTTLDRGSIFNHSENVDTLFENGDAFSTTRNGESNSTNFTNGVESNCKSYSVGTVTCEEIRVAEESGGSEWTVTQLTEPEFQNVRAGKLRQRNVNGTGDDASTSWVEYDESEKSVEVSSASVKQQGEPNGSVALSKLETAKSLDWKRLMAEDPNCESFTSFRIAFLMSNLLLALYVHFVLCCLPIRYLLGGEVAVQVLHGRNVQRQFITEHNNTR